MRPLESLPSVKQLPAVAMASVGATIHFAGAITDKARARSVEPILSEIATTRAEVNQAKKETIDPESSVAVWLREQEARLDEMADLVFAKRRLMVVPPNKKGALIHPQLIDMERVHPLKEKGELVTEDHIRQLLEMRAGLAGRDNKDAVAFTVPTYNGPKVLTQIFRFHARAEYNDNVLDVTTLPGNVEVVRAQPIELLKGDENLTAYWTISSKWPKSGEVLIQELKKVVPKGHLEVTLSPGSSFYQRHDRARMLMGSDDFVRSNAILDIISRKNDVANFHLSNGAAVGWIHVNRDADTHWVTVNYIYERDKAAERQKAFSAETPVVDISQQLYERIQSNVPVVGRINPVLFMKPQVQPAQRFSMALPSLHRTA